MSDIFFTADLHFFHKRMSIVRGFDDVDQMNELLIDKWNSVVGLQDIVYNLGDFSFGKGKETCDIIDRLNGTIRYIQGNHENYLKDFKYKFDWVKESYNLKLPFDGAGTHEGKITIHLHHFAHRVWDKSHRGSWHFFGHTHNELYDDPNSLSIDVGVDANNLYPFTLDEVIGKIKKKNTYGGNIDIYKLWETRRCPFCSDICHPSWDDDVIYCNPCKRVLAEKPDYVT